MDKKYQDAINDLNELIKLAPDNASRSGYMNNIAMCYAELKNKEMEEKYFLDAIEADRNNINAMHGLSAFYLKNGQKEKGVEYLNEVLSINPEDEKAKMKLDSLKNK